MRSQATHAILKIPYIFEELEWYAAPDERVVGALVRDFEDQDFGWVILARDERLRYRAIDVNSTLPDLEAARKQLFERIAGQSRQSDKSFIRATAQGGRMTSSRPLRLSKSFTHSSGS